MKSSAPSPADPEAWNAYLAEGNARQARKRVSADAIVRDPEGRVLLVKPTYKPGWDLPGGMAEENEAPEDAVRRELAEELGLEVSARRLLVVDWVAPHGPWDDQLAFIFDGGTLDGVRVDRLQPQEDDGEVAEIAFVLPGQVTTWLSERAGPRCAAALGGWTRAARSICGTAYRSVGKRGRNPARRMPAGSSPVDTAPWERHRPGPLLVCEGGPG